VSEIVVIETANDRLLPTTRDTPTESRRCRRSSHQLMIRIRTAQPATRITSSCCRSIW